MGGKDRGKEFDEVQEGWSETAGEKTTRGHRDDGVELERVR